MTALPNNFYLNNQSSNKINNNLNLCYSNNNKNINIDIDLDSQSSDSSSKDLNLSSIVKKVKNNFFDKDITTKIKIKMPNISVIKNLSSDLSLAHPIHFDKISDATTGFQLNENDVTVIDNGNFSRYAEIKIDRANARFKWVFYPDSNTLELSYASRGKLPKWSKIGSSKFWINREKGVPTAKLLKLILVNKLKVNIRDVKKIKAQISNPQSFLDIFYDMEFNDFSFEKACANSVTSQLVAEAVEMIKESNMKIDLYLHKLETYDYEPDLFNLKSFIDSYNLGDNYLSEFKNRNKIKLKKFKEMKIDIINDKNIVFPDIDLEYHLEIHSNKRKLENDIDLSGSEVKINPRSTFFNKRRKLNNNNFEKTSL